MVKQLPLLEEAMDIFELKDDGTFTLPVIAYEKDLPDGELVPPELEHELCTAEIHNGIVLGIRDYFSKMGFTKAILGSSGGIDSAVTLVLACKALGKENFSAILMPSQY